MMRYGAYMDWISPLWALLMDFWHGDAVRCAVPAGDALEAKGILKQKRIESWGWVYRPHDESVIFSVHRAQVGLTAHLLGLEPARRRKWWGIGG